MKTPRKAVKKGKPVMAKKAVKKTTKSKPKTIDRWMIQTKHGDLIENIYTTRELARFHRLHGLNEQVRPVRITTID
jgi:hypothetical protein